VNRRKFINGLWVPFTFGIFVPKLIRAQSGSPFDPTFVPMRVAAPIGTAWITSNPPSAWDNGFTGCVGSLFTTDSTARTITDLGLYVKLGNTTTVTVKILNGTTVVASASFNQTGMAEGWNYISVTPVALPASTSLVIVRSTVSGGAEDAWPQEWIISTTGIASSLSSTYAGSCTDEASFTPSTSGNWMYGGSNFKYTTP